MADYNPDQLAQTLVQRGGYNPTDAANAARGPRGSELAREFGIGVTPTYGGGGNFNDVIGQARQQFQQDIQPSVNAFQGQAALIPQQTKQQRTSLQQQSQSLQQRYDSLINDIKGQGEAQVQRQTVTTRNELGRRGIPLSSGVAEQEVTNALNPINAQVGNQIQQTGFAREDALAQIGNAINALPLQEQQQLLAIQQAIGQLQAGAGQNATQAALQMMAQQQQQQQFAQQLGFDQRQQQFDMDQSSQLFPLQLQGMQQQLRAGNKGQKVTPDVFRYLASDTGNRNEAMQAANSLIQRGYDPDQVYQAINSIYPISSAGLESHFQ